jgi:hypothetical protein
VLFEPGQFEPVTDEPWDSARVEDAIAAIVTDADAAFDPEALWPAHDWDGWRAPLPMKNLYVGAAGVIWGSTRCVDAVTPRLPSTSPALPCARSSYGAPSRGSWLVRHTRTRQRCSAARPGRCSSPSGSSTIPPSRMSFTRSSAPTSRTRLTT